ncbi:aspartyl/asparaginyl beta-hydroxylase domain-containing protein [Paraburkholderia sp. 2C]
MSDGAILDAEKLFPGARMLVSNWKKISIEASRAIRHLHTIPRFHSSASAQNRNFTDGGADWRIFIMRAYGVTLYKNLAQCPTVANILASCPDVLSASLSILGPRNVIPPHRGPFRGVLRGYLVLSMPTHGDGTPAAVLTIDHHDYRLREGDFVLWDDTFEHAVRNESDEYRVVLLLDVKRPFMPLDLALLSSAVVWSVRVSILMSRWKSRLSIALHPRGNRPDRTRRD